MQIAQTTTRYNQIKDIKHLELILMCTLIAKVLLLTYICIVIIVLIKFYKLLFLISKKLPFCHIFFEKLKFAGRQPSWHTIFTRNLCNISCWSTILNVAHPQWDSMFKRFLRNSKWKKPSIPNIVPPNDDRPTQGGRRQMFCNFQRFPSYYTTPQDFHH